MQSDWSPLEAAERKMSLVMHLAGLVPSLFFCIYHISYGELWFGLTVVPCASMLLVSLYFICTDQNDQRYKLFDRLFLMLACVPVLAAMLDHDLHGEYFVQALILACFLNLPTMLAERFVMAVTLIAVGIGFWRFGDQEGLRFAIGLIALHIFAWGVARIVVQQNNELHELAFRDSLTKAYNRRALFDELFKAQKHYQRSRQTATIIMLDLDNFKQVNDQYGHPVGDEVLCWFVQKLQQDTRANDRVFRYGGEEFLILLGGTSMEQAYSVSEKLRHSIANDESTPHGSSITFSAGLAEIKPGEDIDTWITRADNGLYHAKHAGRNQTWLAPSTPAGFDI